eukprot:m.267341 g.267341  ORF g.267341 m.267341 type:complete len:123 (+) comp19732_c0_seq7:1054-1422(+)
MNDTLAPSLRLLVYCCIMVTRRRLVEEVAIMQVFLCEQWGNARPEEGSEHYIAYALEAKTGKHYIHGQLIGLCILLVAHFQGQDTGVIGRCLQDLGLDCRLLVVPVVDFGTSQFRGESNFTG